MVEAACHEYERAQNKKMPIGPIRKKPPPPLSLDGAVIDQVKTFKLLRVHVLDDRKWSHHIDAICSKVAYRLHFLKLLVRSGSSLEDLVCFYTSVVRPILEYTPAQSDTQASLWLRRTPWSQYRRERCAFCAKRTTRWRV